MMWEVMKINMDIDGLNGKSGGGVFTGLGIKSGVCDFKCSRNMKCGRGLSKFKESNTCILYLNIP